MKSHAVFVTFPLLLAVGLPAKAQEPDSVPAAVTFVISAGFWQDDADITADGVPSDGQGEDANEPAEEPQRGYYKLIAVRQTDATARIYLQKVFSTPEGPEVISDVELEEFSALGAYVTDIRPEDSRGVSSQAGLFATVYLKTDPQVTEPESWTVIIDEFGDITVERASN